MDMDIKLSSEMNVGDVDVLGAPDGDDVLESCAVFVVDEVVVDDALDSIL